MKIHVFCVGGTIDKIYFDKKSNYEIGDAVVGPLLACLELIAYPNSRHAALSLARSPILGFNDAQAHALLTSKEEHSWWKKIQQHAPNKLVKQFVMHIEHLVLQGAIHDVFDICY